MAQPLPTYPTVSIPTHLHSLTAFLCCPSTLHSFQAAHYLWQALALSSGVLSLRVYATANLLILLRCNWKLKTCLDSPFLALCTVYIVRNLRIVKALFYLYVYFILLIEWIKVKESANYSEKNKKATGIYNILGFYVSYYMPGCGSWPYAVIYIVFVVVQPLKVRQTWALSERY